MATAARKPNWFAIWTSIIVAVIVIGVGAAVVVANNMAKAPLKDAPVAAAPTEDGIVAMGSGSEVVTSYIDFMCPICGQFEENNGDQLFALAKNNDITLEVRAVNMLDSQSQGTAYSSRSANAFMCVAEEKGDVAASFMRKLFDEQPREGSKGLDDAKLISYAKDLGADIAKCQEEMTFVDKAVANFEAMPANANGQKGTPTVTVNGEFTQEWAGSRTWFTDQFGK